jgi:hypothetical protein
MARCSGSTSKGHRCKSTGMVQTPQGEWYCTKHAPPATDNPTLERTSYVFLHKVLFAAWYVAKRFSYTILLLAACFVVHYQIRRYYYTHCESNILRVWLFKQTPICMALHTGLDHMETWAITTSKAFAAYITTLAI